MKPIHLAALLLLLPAFGALAANPGDKLSLGDAQIVREFQFDGSAWKTVRIARGDGSASLDVHSDEVFIVTPNNDVLSVDAYAADGEPAPATDPATKEQSLTISYRLKVGQQFAGAVP